MANSTTKSIKNPSQIKLAIDMCLFHEHQATQWLGVEVSQAEPELSLTQA